jgi:hypothetical protein
MIALDCFLGANWQNLTTEKRNLTVWQAGFFLKKNSCFLAGLGFRP